MNKINEDNHYDVIVVGSGVCGATIAKGLSRQKKKVLILERGGNTRLRESIIGYNSVLNEVLVTDTLKEMRAFTTGGSTALYFALSENPPLEAFEALGVNISDEYLEACDELPLAELPDYLISPQSNKLRESAEQLGYDWQKKKMFIDQTKCPSGYSYEAKWKARSYVEDAIEDGATLINKATVLKVIVDDRKAIGVEYKKYKSVIGYEICRAYANKIVLAAGSLVSPIILRDSGIKSVEKNGFYIDPSVGFVGAVPGLVGKSGFCGCMGTKLDADIDLIDGNFSRFLFNVGMLITGKLSRIFSYPEHVAIVAKVKD
ncbi:MAG: FAD-dependent oxidoreductase, partial [Prevotella sp.]|nr:FAD-dependent oxidoreductase [Prevotella sp.]